MARDPHFDAKAATIDQWWKHYTGQLGPPAAAQGSGDLGVPTDA